MDNQIHIPLDLPDVRINQVSKTEAGAWLIQVESTRNETLCRKCGQPTRHFHGWDEPLRLRHLPLFEVPVYIEIRPKPIAVFGVRGIRRPPRPWTGITVAVPTLKRMSNGYYGYW